MGYEPGAHKNTAFGDLVENCKLDHQDVKGYLIQNLKNNITKKALPNGEKKKRNCSCINECAAEKVRRNSF